MLPVRPGVFRAEVQTGTDAAGGDGLITAWAGGGCPAAAAQQPQAVRQGPEQWVAGMHPAGQGVLKAAANRIQEAGVWARRVMTAQDSALLRHVWAGYWWQEPTRARILTAANKAGHMQQ